MENNQLFLVLPIANDKAMDEECAYLKTISEDASQDEFEAVLKRAVAAFGWARGEEYVLYYDPVRFKDLYKRCSIDVQKQNPSQLQLLNSLCKFTALPPKLSEVRVDYVSLNHGIICGYVDLSGDVLVDHDAMLRREHLNVIDQDGKVVPLVIIGCNREEVFKWFVHNRRPERKIDPNYQKHSSHQKGEGKEVISPCTYSDEEYMSMLPWAVGGPGCRRKYYMDRKKGRLVIFWNENLEIPTYHYYDVPIDDPSENAKMLRECGRDIIEQIKMVSNIS